MCLYLCDFLSRFLPGNGNGARTDVDPMHDLPASNPWSIQERHANGPSN